MKLTSLVFNVVPLDCNTLSPLSLQWSNILKKMKHLGPQNTLLQLLWLHCHREIVAHAEFFKVSEENVVIGSQIWTVGRMVMLYEAIFPYSSPRCAWYVCGCMKKQDITRRLSTTFLFHVLALSHHCGSIGVSSNGCLVCHEFQKQNTLWVPKNCCNDLSGWLLHTKFLGSRGPLVFPLHGLLFSLWIMMIDLCFILCNRPNSWEEVFLVCSKHV